MTNIPADPTCDQIDPLLAAYALGEQDPAAARAIAAHLAGCRRCSDSLAAYQRLAQLLPLGVAEATPSPALRQRVIAAVSAQAAGTPPPPRPAPWRQAPISWAARALGVALLALLLAWNMQLQQQVAALQGSLAGQRQAIAALLASPQHEERALSADPGAPGASARLILTPDRSGGALIVDQMPPLPPGRVYQLWLIADGQRQSGGTFTVDASGSGLLIVRSARPLNTYDAAGVTVEPEGGSPGPTGPRLIGGPLS